MCVYVYIDNEGEGDHFLSARQCAMCFLNIISFSIYSSSVQSALASQILLRET